MAFSENPTFEDLLARIERREKTSRRRAVLYTLIPITMAIVLLAYTANRVQRATDQVLDLKIQASRYKEQTTQLRNQITDLQTKLADAEKRVQEATEFGRYIHPIDLIDLKVIYSKYPREARILERILDLRQSGVKWRLGGQTPTEGFDSPSFAAFVLRQLNLPGGEVRPGESLVASSRRLWELLRPVSQPRVGDLAFYPAGYALFYFMDRGEKPFVIGMTPLGIAALEANFAKVVGYRRAAP